MIEEPWFAQQSALTLDRLLPRLKASFGHGLTESDWDAFAHRLEVHFPQLFRYYHQLYGHQFDFLFQIEDLLNTAAHSWVERSEDLRGLDASREIDPHWFESNRMVGAMCYVDLFSGDLMGLVEQIPYLKELSVSYLHLMPLFRTPSGDDDGGYAVSSYREVDPNLGTMEQLSELAAELRRQGISLAVDFILNHTADDHEWAKKALRGDPKHQAFYRLYPDRKMPDAFEKTITPVFPDEHPGCFTYQPRLRRWIWTTFHNYQWDLNYENPAVFNAMAGEMLFLANAGTEVLRFDAAPYLWKRLGTNCQNQPEVHWIIRALNAVARIAAPALAFKSEAIVHPDEVARFVSSEECQLSYNPQLMALLWESLATRETRLLRHGLAKRFVTPSGCAWVNYVRCHDDIGWGFADDDAREIGISPQDHRRFLAQFYSGSFSGSFARGQTFQEDPVTGEARNSGTTASLVGLERGIEWNSELEIENAVRRILLLHGVLMTIGGIPLIYLGDELGMLNDYGYVQDPDKDGDSRWLHRLPFNTELAEKRRDYTTIPGRIHSDLQRLVQIRQQNQAFSGADTEIADLENNQVLGFFRQHHEHSAFVLANFSDNGQVIAAHRLRQLGLRKNFTDLVSGRFLVATRQLELEPYQFMILVGPGR